MTNFEKIISSLTKEDIADYLQRRGDVGFPFCRQCAYTAGDKNCRNKTCTSGIAKWLDREVQNDLS